MLIINDYIFFQAKIKSELTLRKWKYADLARATGLSIKTIEAFMCKSGNKSENVANAIAHALKIER